MAITAEKNLGARMNIFQPDLIIEVTGACNRACSGCYAPNVVAKDAASIFEKRPELFIGIEALNDIWKQFQTVPSITAIRGGEPTLHPELPAILNKVATHSEHVFLETHGRWLIEDDFIPYLSLLESIKTNGVLVKISFDKMHGLKAEELQKITHFLNWHDVDYRIAITEVSIADYMVTRSMCRWITDDKIIYQPKASRADELMQPTIGTINVRGELKMTLTHKFEESSFGIAYA